MKQIEKVSIAGISFTIDLDAFEALGAYLSNLKMAYKENPDGDEIIADIEARIAELILSRQDANSIVDKVLVDIIIEQMGLPEEAAAAIKAANSDSGAGETFPRRLYRNPEGAKLGGVCGGIATFLDIDPVWVRLAVFAPLVLVILSSPFGAGSGFFALLFAAFVTLYVILWFVVPMAKTPRQKLEMRGKPITTSSIESSLKREFSSVYDTKNASKNASVWAELFYTFGRIVLFFIKGIALIFTLALALFGVTLITGVGVVLSGGIDKLFWGNWEISDFVSQISFIAPEGYVIISLLLMLIPVFLIVWLLFCLIFDRPLSGKFFSITGGIWLIIAIYWGVITIKAVTDYNYNDRFQFHPRQRIERTIIDGKVVEEKITPLDSLKTDSLPDGKVAIPRETIK